MIPIIRKTMKTDITRTNSGITVRIEGRLDTLTSADFDAEVNALGSIDSDITLNCADMEYISSAGLRSLITLLKRTKASGHRLEVRDLRPSVRPVFDMTGFSSLFNIE